MLFRATFIAAVTQFLVVASSPGQLPDVLDGMAAGGPAHDMTRRYLLDKADAALDRRKDNYEKIKTREDITDYQKKMREFLV